MDEARHDPDLALAWRDDSGAVRSHQASGRSSQYCLDPDHVIHGNALGDAHDEFDARIGRFEDRICSAGGGYIDHARGCASFPHSVLNRIEHRQAEMPLSAAPGSNAANELSAVRERSLGMESALFAGESLANHLGIAINQNTHFCPFASATTLRAASVRSVAGVIAKPLLASISRALSALVPSSRTTTGTFTLTFFTALMTPSAIR